MIRSRWFRRIAEVVAVALTLGTTVGSASGRTFDFNARGSLVQQQAPQVSRAGSPAAGGSGIEWGYVAIGSSAAALTLIGVGGAVAAGRRGPRRDRAGRPTIVS